jgi:tetratricopeptide (TPR) repeat protein
VIQEAIRLDPENPQYFSLLAGICYVQKRWQEALEAAEQGLALDPEHVNCTNVRAMALIKLGREKEAGATIASALAKVPDNAVTHANQGWALLEQRDHRQALEHFREALRLDPNLDWARAGIVEALKARYLIYRLMLTYFLWMAKLSGKAQWAVILVGYFAYRALRSVAKANPAVAPYIEPLLYLYLAFVFLSWTADPLFNLLLRLNRFGRLALSAEQLTASNWIGACVLGGLLGLGAWLVMGYPAGKFAAGYFGLLMIPVAGTFSCPAGWPRAAMALYTGLLAALGLVAQVVLFLAAHERITVPTELVIGLAVVFALGVVSSGWIANVLMMIQPKH